MQTYKITLQPLTAFGTPMAGDTLFGQLCWAMRHLYGNARLTQLLENYANNQPWLVVGDALPNNHLPLPALPARYWEKSEQDRKTLKKKHWLATEHLLLPVSEWQGHAKNDHEVNGVVSQATQAHNTIDRMTGTTGTGQFAPYTQAQYWYQPGTQWDIYLVLDETRCSKAELSSAWQYMAHSGYGRDASIGLGKFKLCESAPQQTLQPITPHRPPNANAWLTLGPCAPQNADFLAERSFYQTTTRFGRHGDVLAVSGQPFKKPILLAKTGAVFTPETLHDKGFIGQGLTGISNIDTKTVQQGYAPVLAIALPGHLTQSHG